MSGHAPRTMERHCDVAVIGGSAAGLAAALQLGRQRRSVIVIDAGEPRNAPAAHMHGYLGHEGLAPSGLTAIGRAEVRSYGVEVLDGRVVGVTRDDGDRFRLQLVGGHVVVARKVLVATGIVDVLPDIEGVADHWGRDVIHCPFCHGYEVRDRRLVHVVTHPMGLHPATLFRQLTDEFTVVLQGDVEVDADQIAGLEAAGVRVVRGTAVRLVDGDDGAVTAVELADGERLDADAVVVTTHFRPRVEALVPLGLETTPHASGLGDVVQVDSTGGTSIPGLYAAGNVTEPGQQVLHAAADGSRAGAMIAFALAHEDIAAAARPSGNAADWDHRYSGERMWSGNPNGSLVAEVEGLPAGRALDIGAGEGGDAIWLAERGWQVTASDISQRALDQIAAEADRRGLEVECLLADATAHAPFEREGYDLVCAQYASIPRTGDDRAVRNLLDPVAPGGRLLVVSHDLAPMRVPIDTSEHSQAFDPDAFLRVEDLIGPLKDGAAWEIEVHEVRPRPSGAASSHHVDDMVLRARRLPG